MDLFVISQIFGWIATFFRAGGMLVKDPMRIKWLVSIGNLGWMISGILTANVPLIVSNAICLVVMIIEIVKNYRRKK